ncbi:hypothetical protein ABEB36_013942 [Hypothenemus hampei]|uniref:DUF4817 domain-containing protein n=1 Tax=Hypothenemus hampei TaxID=57062 RepID=A0ABD1EA94_HYPHA
MAQFTPLEYGRIIFIYGFCNGNGEEAAREYHRRFPESRQPSVKVFANTYRRLCETGSTIPKNNGGLQAALENLANEIAIIHAVENDPEINYPNFSKMCH